MNIATANVIANQLRDSVVGKKISKVIANQNPHTFVWFAMKPEEAYIDDRAASEFEEYMVGKTICDCAVNLGGYGIYDFLYLGDRALISDIVPRYYEASEKLPQKHQLLLMMQDGSSLAYTASLGGALFLFRIDGNGSPINYCSSFPCILSESFSFDFFLELIKTSEHKVMSVKQFLATKNRIPGIDNSLLQDILWEAGVNPKSKMTTLGMEEYQRIYNTIKKVIPTIIQAGGKDIDKDIYGQYGSYPTKASRNTNGSPCSRCGTTIVKEAYLGGSIQNVRR